VIEKPFIRECILNVRLEYSGAPAFRRRKARLRGEAWEIVT
jgi:hypothetical protein